MSKIRSTLLAAALGALISGGAHATPGDGDPFELTFGPTGIATLDACTGPCTFGLGPDNGVAVSNVGGLGGNGFSFALPEDVGTGIAEVLNSSLVEVAVLDFISPTVLDYIVSGAISNYTSPFTAIAGPNGSFTLLGPYPTDNQYNGTAPSSSVPEPMTLTLLGVALTGLFFTRRRAA